MCLCRVGRKHPVLLRTLGDRAPPFRPLFAPLSSKASAQADTRCKLGRRRIEFRQERPSPAFLHFVQISTRGRSAGGASPFASPAAKWRHSQFISQFCDTFKCVRRPLGTAVIRNCRRRSQAPRDTGTDVSMSMQGLARNEI